LSKRKSMPATAGAITNPEEFMAILVWAQSGKCNCPAAQYFKRLGKQFVKQYIEGEVRG